MCIRDRPSTVPKKLIKIPVHPLSDRDLYEYTKLLRIPYFRGVYMRDTLPSTSPWENESAIVNLDDATGPGTHLSLIHI